MLTTEERQRITAAYQLRDPRMRLLKFPQRVSGTARIALVNSLGHMDVPNREDPKVQAQYRREFRKLHPEQELRWGEFLKVLNLFLCHNLKFIYILLAVAG